MKHKGLFWILIVLFVIITGAAFPIYNWEKHYSYALTGISIISYIVSKSSAAIK